MAPLPVRSQAWEHLARDLEVGKRDSITREISLGIDQTLRRIVNTAASLPWSSLSLIHISSGVGSLLTLKQDRLQGNALVCRHDSLRANLLEAETFMETPGWRIRWVDVVLAGNEARSATLCKCKEIFI